jgi:hypothetical protein
MRYQVTFRKRFNDRGRGSDSPQALLDLPDGVVLESEVVEEIEPDSVTVDEAMDEDSVEPFGSEIWEYVVADGRRDEFVNALKESSVVLEYDAIDDADDEIDESETDNVAREAEEDEEAGGDRPESELE